DAQRDVAVRRAHLVLLHTPVVGELELGVLGVPPVAQEGERELPTRVVLARDELHAERVLVEGDRALEITDPQHRVQDPHAASPLRARGRGPLFAAGAAATQSLPCLYARTLSR